MSTEKEDNSKSDESNQPLFETADFWKSGSSAAFPNANGTDANDFETGQFDTPREISGSVAPKTFGTETPFPTDIPGFEVQRELGRGAFGVVYAAHDTMLDRMVAIKRPIISDPAHRQQYIDEARKAVKLDHPGIVPIYHVGLTAQGEPFVVQKLIEGSSLRGVLRQIEGRLPIDQVVAVMRQVCLAVDAAHTAGLVHRDLKPENLLVEPSGRTYVADFGLAILDDELGSKSRDIAGTPFYMSPEQFTGRNDWLDGRSDIWAIGVIFYELLSGKTPFFGNSLSELKDEIRNRDPRPLHQRDPAIPREFDAFFRKCCAKQVADRFATVHDLIVELDQICDILSLVPFNWSGERSGSVSFGAASTRGSFFDRSRDSLVMSSGTHRSMSSTMRKSSAGSIQHETVVVRSLFDRVLMVAVVCLIVAIGAAYLFQIGRFQQPIAKLENVEVLKEEGSSKEIANNEFANKDDPKTDVKTDLKKDAKESAKEDVKVAVKPAKPFVVSVKEGGTHRSIASAIADSDAGDSIEILEGTYRESLIMDRNLNLIGKGRVRVMSADEGCMEIRGESQVSIDNIDFDCQANEHNAIEIFGGKLTLKNCDVFAVSPHAYDCVKARSNCTFVADSCNFQSNEHAAIYGDKDSTLALRNCRISFPANSDFGDKRCGVQAIGALGLMRDCVVIGPCVAGFHWMDSPTKPLTVEKCRFENCAVGIQTRNCGDVQIKGSAEQLCEVSDARCGINIVNSQASVEFTSIDGSDDSCNVGLQITNGSEVQLKSGSFVGMRCGAIVFQSKLIIDELEVKETSFAGILVDESNIDAESIRISNVEHFGLAVLSTNARVNVKSIEVSAVLSGGERLTSAIYATSGEVSFNEADFNNCLCGVMVDPDRVIIQDIYRTNALPDLLIQSNLMAGKNLPLPRVSGEKLSLMDCQSAWLFNGIGSGKIGELVGNLDPKHRIRLLAPNKLELDGTDISDFSVRLKSQKK